MKSPYLWSIVSGILIGTSYIPFPPWAIFFCFVPLWRQWLTATSWKRIFWTGWLSQFVLALIGFNWVSYTMHEFGHMPWPAAFLLLAAFASICTLSIPCAGVVWWFYQRRFKLGSGARIWTLVAISSLAERGFPMIFDWHFGYTWLWAGFPGFHLADVIGFIGLSNIGLLFNGFVLYAFERARPRSHAHAESDAPAAASAESRAAGNARSWHPGRWPRSTWFFLALPLVGFGALNVLGAWHAKSAIPATDAAVRVLIAQANIGNEEKLLSETGSAFRDTILNRFYRLTEAGLTEARAQGADGVDFAVWPETAFPDFIDSPGLSMGFAVKLRQALESLNVKLITGGYSHIRNVDGQGGGFRATNSFFTLDEQGRWTSPPYHKTILLAFGEYFPGANLFPKLRQWFPEVADFGRGPGPTVLSLGGWRIGAQICYEGLFDWFARELANKGAQMIVNVTNDSWYGSWQEPYQHGFMTLSRAVEVRRPLVRSTNTGLSAVILASGEVLPLSPVYQEWQRVFTIPLATNPPATAFMGWGYWLIPSLLALTLVGAPLLAFRRKKM